MNGRAAFKSKISPREIFENIFIRANENDDNARQARYNEVSCLMRVKALCLQ